MQEPTEPQEGHLRSLEKKPEKFMSSPNNEGFSSIFGHDGDLITQKLKWETTSDCGSLAKSSTFEIDTNQFTRKDKEMAFERGKNLSSIPLQNYAPMGLNLMEELVQVKGLIPFCNDKCLSSVSRQKCVHS